MAASTKIEWADSTANLWMGCTKLSPGCDHCYAEADSDHRKHRVQWGPHGARSYVKTGWNLLRQMQRRAGNNNGVDPELGRKRRIFVNSLSDFFDNHRSIIWRHEAFRLFEACPDVIIMLVTKRPENVVRMVPASWLTPNGWPQHVWLLASAEDQARYDHRWPILRDVPGVAVRGLSLEPLLGPIVLRDLLHLDWAIVGGESGAGARPIHPAWVRDLRDQCSVADVAFLFKQWGDFLPEGQLDRDGFGWAPGQDGRVHWWMPEPLFGTVLPDAACSIRIGKGQAGRLLDNRTWTEFPLERAA